MDNNVWWSLVVTWGSMDVNVIPCFRVSGWVCTRLSLLDNRIVERLVSLPRLLFCICFTNVVMLRRAMAASC
jgi:hypothetical protein